MNRTTGLIGSHKEAAFGEGGCAVLKFSIVKSLAVACLGIAAVLHGSDARATLINGGFEGNFFPAWSFQGNFGIFRSAGPHMPTEGLFQLIILSTNETFGPLEAFLGLTLFSISSVTSTPDQNPQIGAAVRQVFSATAGQVITFDWNFLNGEPADSTDVDFAFASLVGPTTQTIVRLADSLGTDFPIDRSFGPVKFGNQFIDQGATGFQSGVFTVPETGTFTLGFGAINEERADLSGLLIDNVQQLDELPPDPTNLSEPAGVTLFGLGLAGLALARRRRAG